MEIERTTFRTITIDGKTYEHEVIIRLSGEVAKRKKKLSKKYYGTSHVVSEDEARFVFEKGCEQLVLGSGQFGNVHLSPEAGAYFARKGCAVLLQPTPEAIHTFNNSCEEDRPFSRYLLNWATRLRLRLQKPGNRKGARDAPPISPHVTTLRQLPQPCRNIPGRTPAFPGCI